MDGSTATTSSQAVIKFQAGEQEFLQISRRLPLMAVPMELLGGFKKAKRLEFALNVIQLQIINLPRSMFQHVILSMCILNLIIHPLNWHHGCRTPRLRIHQIVFQVNFELTKKCHHLLLQFKDLVQGLVFFWFFGHFQRWISVEDGGFLTGFFAVAFHGEIPG